MELSFIRVTWPKAIYRPVWISEWPPTSITLTGNYCDLLTMTLFPGLISLLLSITFSVSTLIGPKLFLTDQKLLWAVLISFGETGHMFRALIWLMGHTDLLATTLQKHTWLLYTHLQ